MRYVRACYGMSVCLYGDNLSHVIKMRTSIPAYSMSGDNSFVSAAMMPLSVAQLGGEQVIRDTLSFYYNGKAIVTIDTAKEGMGVCVALYVQHLPDLVVHAVEMIDWNEENARARGHEFSAGNAAARLMASHFVSENGSCTGQFGGKATEAVAGAVGGKPK